MKYNIYVRHSTSIGHEKQKSDMNLGEALELSLIVILLQIVEGCG